MKIINNNSCEVLFIISYLAFCLEWGDFSCKQPFHAAHKRTTRRIEYSTCFHHFRKIRKHLFVLFIQYGKLPTSLRNVIVQPLEFSFQCGMLLVEIMCGFVAFFSYLLCCFCLISKLLGHGDNLVFLFFHSLNTFRHVFIALFYCSIYRFCICMKRIEFPVIFL